MDIKKLSTAVRKLQGPLLINHLILLVQFWMMSWQRTAFSIGCTIVTLIACAAVWFAVYRRYNQL